MAIMRNEAFIANDNSPKADRVPKLRFTPVLSLETGEAICTAAQTDMAYEEHAFFGFASGEEFACPANWLGNLIEQAGRLATMRGELNRPIVIVAPAAALTHPDAPMAAEAGAMRANMCCQEFRLEFSDGALADEDVTAYEYLFGFRRRGFRLGIDARASWRSPYESAARALIEAVRFDGRTLDILETNLDRFDVACEDGILLYACEVEWRDAERLRGYGLTHALSPRADA